jgi:hypothetical protein
LLTHSTHNHKSKKLVYFNTLTFWEELYHLIDHLY